MHHQRAQSQNLKAGASENWKISPLPSSGIQSAAMELHVPGYLIFKFSTDLVYKLMNGLRQSVWIFVLTER